MGLWIHVRESLSNLLSAKLRSLLAILGILVGTGSVVALISSSQLATDDALAQFKRLGTNLLAVTINAGSNLDEDGNPTGDSQDSTDPEAQTNSIKLSDVSIIKKNIPEILKIVPYTELFQSLHFQDVNFQGQVVGATESLADIVKVGLKAGRFVSFLDNNSFYCVIGSDIAKQIYAKGINPLGKQISVGRYLFTIVGVADEWEPNLFLFSNLNENVIIPLPLSFLLQKQLQLRNLLLQLKPEASLKEVKGKLMKLIPQIAPGNQARFHDPQQIIDVLSKQRATFTWLLSSIGGISLLVGGIGVMNIMLVSVIERRREIGIRMAIGAKRKDILQMFLIESVVLTVCGGLLGIFLGTATTFILTLFTHWAFTIHLTPVLLGFFVSAIVGLFSGIYPSYRASQLDPIATLQSD